MEKMSENFLLSQIRSFGGVFREGDMVFEGERERETARMEGNEKF